ncbi:MAG: HEAT repeat domain-containing protein [Candidatus Scalinduaceae bacterium]
MKRPYFSFLVLINIFSYGLVSFENKDVSAEDIKANSRISQEISSEFRIKIDEWMKLLYSEDPEIRSSAIISLLGLNQPVIYDSLIYILRNSENDDVRISLIKAFDFAEDDKAIDCMIELLASENESIQIASANALGNIRTNAAIETMIAVLLNAKDPINSRILIASALAKTRSREAVEPLISLLDSDSEELRIAAQNALVEVTKQSDGNTTAFWQEWWDRNKVKTREQWLEDIVDELEEDLRKLKEQNNMLSDEIARKTITILKTRKEKGDIKQLLDAIKSEYDEVRIFAAGELAKHRETEVVKIFVDLISDDNTEIRVLAAKTLGEIGDVSGLESLILALHDKEVKVREATANALGKLGKQEAVVPLLSALNDSKKSVVCIAAESLGEIGANEAVEPLINLLSNEDSRVKESVIVALGKIQDRRAIDPLINSLGDSEERVRWYAADSLGKIGVKRPVSPLITLLSDESARVRESAATALGQIGDESAVEPLIKLLKDRDSRVTEVAANELLSIDCKKFEALNNIANAFYVGKDYERAIEILKKQIDNFENTLEYSHALWQSKLKLAKSYFLLDNCQKAILIYEGLVVHFENDMEIKHELVHCLREAKQHDKLLNFFSSWIENLLTDNRLWWHEIYKILEEYFERGDYGRVRELVDEFEKKDPYMGGSELRSKFYDLRKKSIKTLLPQNNKLSYAIG